jgi:hypothetical protein
MTILVIKMQEFSYQYNKYKKMISMLGIEVT